MSNDPYLLFVSYMACPCRANKAAFFVSLRPWLASAAYAAAAKAHAPADDDRIDELVQEATTAILEYMPKLRTKTYVLPSHLRADVNQIAARSMSEALDFERPNGIGVTAAARYSRRRRGTAEYRETDPRPNAIEEDIDPANVVCTRYPAEPYIELERRDRGEFLAWFRSEWDRQGDWLERAVIVLVAFPEFQHRASRYPNLDRLARFLNLPSKVLKRRLVRLAGRVAAECPCAQFAELGEEIWGNDWIRAAKIGKRQKDTNRGADAA